jgi:hypothetical protein
MTEAPTLARRPAAADAQALWGPRRDRRPESAAPRLPSSVAGRHLPQCYARCLEQPTGVLALALRRGADMGRPGGRLGQARSRRPGRNAPPARSDHETAACECGRPGCQAIIPLGAEAYRRRPGRLIVVPEHFAGKKVVAAADHFFVVEL